MTHSVNSDLYTNNDSNISVKHLQEIVKGISCRQSYVPNASILLLLD